MKHSRMIDSWNTVVPDREAKDRMFQKIRDASYAASRPYKGSFLRYGAVFCAALAVTVLLILFSFPQMEPEPATASDLSTSQAAAPSAATETIQDYAAAAAEPPESADAETSVSIYWQVGPLPELAERSSLIVRGTVTGRSDAFTVQDPDGILLDFTDYYMEPLETLRGSLNGAEQVSVRVNSLESASEECRIDVGQEYVFFLHRSGEALGPQFSDGDAYQITYAATGLFRKKEDGRFGSFHETASLEEIRQAAAPFKNVPFEVPEEVDGERSGGQVILSAAVGSADDDPRLALPRSNRMSARYLDRIPDGAVLPRSIAELIPWTDKERSAFFAESNRETVLGTVERVRQIEISTDENPDGKTYRTVVELRVEQTLQGSLGSGALIQLLLPQAVSGDPSTGNDVSEPLYFLSEGVRGIFPITEIANDDLGPAVNDGNSNTPRLYLRDLAEYQLNEWARGLVVENGGSLCFPRTDYPQELRASSLEEFLAYLQKFLSPAEEP